MRNLVLADNQEITRYELKQLSSVCSDIGDIQIVCRKEELVKVLLCCPFSLVILDYTLFDLTSADELLILEQRFSETQWILFSHTFSEDFIYKIWVESTRIGMVMKDCPLSEVEESIHCGLRAERYVCQRIVRLMQPQPLFCTERKYLTATEKEILKAIAMGKTTKEIAAERFLSVHTVMTHRKNIFRKLRVNNVHEATKYAMHAGIVNMAEYYI